MSSNRIYTIELLDTGVKKEVDALPKSARELIKKAIIERLASNPIAYGKPLRFSLKGHRSLRVSKYRVIYRIDEPNKTVLILSINSRKVVYDYKVK